MKRKILIMCSIGCLLFGISGCGNTESNNAETYKAYTFEVETGDTVRIELDTTGGYDMSSDVPFEITENGGLTRPFWLSENCCGTGIAGR